MYPREPNSCDVIAVETISVPEIKEKISDMGGLAEGLSLDECRHYANVDDLLQKGLTMIRVYLPSDRSLDEVLKKSGDIVAPSTQASVQRRFV